MVETAFWVWVISHNWSPACVGQAVAPGTGVDTPLPGSGVEVDWATAARCGVAVAGLTADLMRDPKTNTATSAMIASASMTGSTQREPVPAPRRTVMTFSLLKHAPMGGTANSVPGQVAVRPANAPVDPVWPASAPQRVCPDLSLHGRSRAGAAGRRGRPA